MRSSLGRLIRPFLTDPALVLSVVILFGFPISSAYSQTVPPNTPGAPVGDISNIPKGITDTMDRVAIRNGARDNVTQGKKIAEPEANCLFPPLSLITSPVIGIEELRRTAKARNEYWQGCLALKKKRNANAEQHFRKAIRQYPKYVVALVTLGQLVAKEQRTQEARKACSQASTVNTSYAPAYLCLADIAMREHSWKEVLTLSDHVLEIDAFSNFIAYEYHAAANLYLHNLAAAEKSGLRAAELDREHREPRIYFVLAQIYEAKGDFAEVAAQLRAYLKYTDSPLDAAMVQQYLSNLEKRTGAVHRTDSTERSEKADSTPNPWAPPDIDASVPPVLSGSSACPLPEILKQASNHTLDLIENMRRFSASEQIEQFEIDRNGTRHNSGTEVTNYVVEIEQRSSGYPTINEYRAGGNRIRRMAISDSGGSVFALIFHPSHIENFEFRCEGLTDVEHSPAWQVHFVEGDDPNKAFTAIKMGGSIHLPRLKGRAWISADGYNVLRIETDLVDPIAKIDVQREHQVITYAPVEFPAKHIRLWLPDRSSIYIATHRHHYERVHTFAEFQLFSVDSMEAVKQPSAKKPDQFLNKILAESGPFERKVQQSH
jgi:tetratricopeptide (TPR) repeat protein